MNPENGIAGSNGSQFIKTSESLLTFTSEIFYIDTSGSSPVF